MRTGTGDYFAWTRRNVPFSEVSKPLSTPRTCFDCAPPDKDVRYAPRWHFFFLYHPRPPPPPPPPREEPLPLLPEERVPDATAPTKPDENEAIPSAVAKVYASPDTRRGE
jgi:hypothetical protein